MKIDFNNTDKKLLIILLVILLVNALPQLYLWNNISDDAFISFRYAERMLEGKGLTFNDGEHVEGFSNPLWIFLIAIFSKITSLDVLTSARVLGFISSNLIFFFILLIIKVLFEKQKSITFLIFVSSILLFTPGLHVYNTSGMEGPLLSLLLISAVYFSINKHKYHFFIASFIMGLVGICRPEGLLYSLLWLLFTLDIYNSNVYAHIKRLFLIMFPSLIYLIFRWIYYGELLPNTAYAKPSGTYSFLVGIKENFNYYIILSIPLIVVLIVNYIKNDRSQNIFFRSIAGLVLANFIFLIYAGGDWMFFGRFLLPVWPILTLGFSYLLLSLLFSITENLTSFTLLTFICLLGFIISEIIIFQGQLFEYNSNNNYANLMKGKDQLTVGKWLNNNIQSNSTVATFRIGGISYGAPKLIFYDTFGLTDKVAAKYRNATKVHYNVLDNPIIKRDPDILAVINQSGYRMITVESVKGLEELLEKKYSLIKTFRQGDGIHFEIWINKEKRSKILLSSFRNNDPDKIVSTFPNMQLPQLLFTHGRR